ncbi:unnamed protein product, partial [Ectocarpus sp. 4 AP-2014]
MARAMAADACMCAASVRTNVRLICNPKAKMHLTSLVLPTLCLGVAIGVTTAQTCDNGLAGVSTGVYCCTLGCGTCGGSGCSSRAAGLNGDDCCTSNIASNGILCADSGAAPCIGDIDDDVPTETETETETETVGSSYLGCFSDLPGSRIFMFEAATYTMTADACLALCADSAYYGTQYSEECWCGAEGADYDANGEGDCTMRCTGDTDQICGGYNAMSVYEINSDDGETDDVDGGEIDDPSYLGCYSDPADNRVFVQDISFAAMTAEVCSEACAGSAYYGTQYSTEVRPAQRDLRWVSCEAMIRWGGSSRYKSDIGFEKSPYDSSCSPIGNLFLSGFRYNTPSDNHVLGRVSAQALGCMHTTEHTYVVYPRRGDTVCWCGSEGADYDANGAGVCDMPCGGDADEICGGFYAMSVYENDVDGGETDDVDDGETEDPSYLGCYSDSADSRVFVQDISSAAMTAELCSEACAGSAYYGTQYSTEALTTMPTARVSATCPAAATPTRSAEVSTPSRSTRTARTTGSRWSSRAPATPECRPVLPAAKPTAVLAEARVAAPAAPAPLRAAPRASSPLASFAPTPGPPRASSKFPPSLLDVAPRIAHLAHHGLPTNRAMVSLLHQTWRNSAQLVSFQDLWR